MRGCKIRTCLSQQQGDVKRHKEGGTVGIHTKQILSAKHSEDLVNGSVYKSISCVDGTVLMAPETATTYRVYLVREFSV